MIYYHLAREWVVLQCAYPVRRQSDKFNPKIRYCNVLKSSAKNICYTAILSEFIVRFVTYLITICGWLFSHDDVIKWKHFPRYWPFVRGIHRSPVNSPHKGQWRGALMFSLICVWINAWVNNSDPGELRRHRAHYDVTVIVYRRDLMRLCSCKAQNSKCITFILLIQAL